MGFFANLDGDSEITLDQEELALGGMVRAGGDSCDRKKYQSDK